MGQTKIGMLYDLYVENPDLTNAEAKELLDVSDDMIRKMKSRLKRSGYIQIDDNGEVFIMKPYRKTTAAQNSFKAEVYREMVETYLNDFRCQSAFNERLTVGREIRLILEKM